MTRILIFIAILCTAVHAFAADNAQLYQLTKANDFYRHSNYDSAAWYYEQLTATRPAQAGIYYNLGNSYYRLNNIGKAVLNYQRALKLEPDNTLAADNLYLTENRISNRVQAMPELKLVTWWAGFTSGSNAAMLAITALMLFLLLLVCLWLRSHQFMRPQYIGGAAFLWVIVLCTAFVAAGNKASHSMAVVMKNDAPLFANPTQAKVQSYIPEGTTLKLDKEQNGYLSITLPDGRRGWLDSNLIERI